MSESTTKSQVRSRRRWPKRAVLVVLVLAGVAAAVAFALVARPWEERIPVYAAETLEPGPISLVLAVNGRVAPRQSVSVRPQVSAKVVSVEADEGEAVTEGQVLVRLDDAQAQAELDQANAAVEAGLLTVKQVEAKLERAKALGENVARSTLEDAERELDSARNEVARLRAVQSQAKSRLEQYTIEAPMDGVVLERSVEPGQLADTQTALFEVADLKRLHVETDVDEIYASRVHQGLKALMLPVGETVARDGQVDFASPSVDPATGGRSIRIGFEDPTDLPVGLTVNVNIFVDEFEDALSVPRSALVTEGSDTVVRVIEDGVVVERAVKVLDWPAERVKVNEGLEAGDAVILDPGVATVGEAASAG
ncbi:efflux RND transporter periplasmic adaptor subunit [Cucumibacter marinus]|uniref:efflux RND transporter periplasmic adaptor subunit n=1 Tax=Cucumibacter marinus TaxID=1121252 RepID=UPI000686DA9F|nr:efflux RND transporter periplasmic adaptor subunit [Cucumibacter marinus]